MRKFKLPLNLQLFAEGDADIILPDDFVDTQPEDFEMPAEEPLFDAQFDAPEGFESDQVGEDTTPPTEGAEAEQEPEETPQPQTIRIKFNHQEMDIPVEEAAQLAQKGMVFEKAVERARQEARDAVIAEMGLTWNGKPIKTEAEYKQALAEQELIKKYQDRDLPPEVIQELVESRRFREEQLKQKQKEEEEAKRAEEFNKFFAYFEEVNERPFDPQKDTLPQEVQEAVNNGEPLLMAYMRHVNKELRNQLKIAKQNQANMKKAPVGSVTAGGGVNNEPEDLFLQGFNSIL